MKANDLRIGNYVKAPLGEIMRVDRIGHPDNHDYIHARNETEFGQNGFKGIALTPEILEKCGFEWSIYHQAFHKHEDGHEVYDLNECYPKGYQFSTFKKGHLVGKPIFYMHQLQNLIHALTGEELEVKL